jgi:ABC-2 type transport system ATP-binding protein
MPSSEVENLLPYQKALVVEDLVKYYGDFQALKGVSFNIDKGEIFGLIGPNAAGKTTALRVISTLLTFNSGKVNVFDCDLGKEPAKVRELISYLPEEAGAYKNLSGIEYFNFISSFYANSVKERKEMTERSIKIADLGSRIRDKVSNYSKGMVRKLLVARALMPEAKLTILDEPTSGLDVINSVKIRKIIQDFKKRGITFLVSSHNMLEVEFLCDRIALINEGKIVEEGQPIELKEKYQASNIEEVFEGVIKESYE